MLCTINKYFLFLNLIYSFNTCIFDKKKYCVSIKDLFKFHIYCALISLFVTFKFSYLENLNTSIHLHHTEIGKACRVHCEDLNNN